MKEYINRLSLGKFRYDIPDIIKPDDVVRVDVLCGTYSEEQLHIQASDVIKGVVYSSDSRVVIKNGTFIGRECSITYIADARELQDKETSTCLYSANPNLVRLQKDALANDIRLIELEKKEASQ